MQAAAVASLTISTAHKTSCCSGQSHRLHSTASLQPSHVPPQNVHDDGLGNVVSVMPRNQLVHPQQLSTPVQGLPAEHTAECAVVAPTHLQGEVELNWGK